MKWLRIILSSLCFFVWASPSFAINPTQVTSILSVVAQKASVKGAPVVVDLVAADGHVAQSIVVEAASKQMLEQASPSKVAVALEELKQSGKYSFKAMATEKIIGFPMESFGFFISLGAVMAAQLIFDYSQNPVAYEQLLQSQMDPVGQLAFLSFLIATGASTGPFSNMIMNGKLNPKLAPFVGYAGMGVGTVAQNIVSEVGHMPGLQQCAKDLWNMSTRSGKKFQGCDESHKAWNDKGGGVGLASEWAPGLVSLLGTMIVSGAVQTGLNMTGSAIKTSLQTRMLMNGTMKTVLEVTGKMATQQILKYTGIEIATFFIPGGIVVKGARLAIAGATFVGQLTVFNGVQYLIDPPIKEAYRDIIDGMSLSDRQKSLMHALIYTKQIGWDSSENLSSQVQAFSKSMGAWRQSNMTEVSQAQSNWEQAIGSFSGMYDKAHMFYSDFISEIRQRNFGKYKDLYQSGEEVRIIDQIFSLNGIKAAKVDTKDASVFLSSPEQILAGQQEHLTKVIQSAKTVCLRTTCPQLSSEESKKWNALISELETNNLKRIGKAIDSMNCYLGIQNPSSSGSCLLMTASLSFKAYLASLHKALGAPLPLWNAGQGYVSYYSNFNFKPQEVDALPFQKSFHGIATTTLAESLLASMIYGPDLEKGESVVVEHNGFKTIFRPPQIRNDFSIPEVTADQIGNRTTTDFLKNLDVFQSQIYRYLTTGGIRSSVMAEDAKSFENWWQAYPEKEYLKTWVDYERLYQKNIARLIKRLWQSDDRLNVGPAANGLISNLRQENMTYLMILGEAVRDSKKDKATTVKDVGNVSRFLLERVRPLENDFKGISNLDFTFILNNYRKTPGLKALPNFAWQNILLNHFNELAEILKKIKVQKITAFDGVAEDLPISSITNQQIKDKLKAISTSIEEIEKNELATLKPTQAAVAKICLKQLEKNFQEAANLGVIANTVSYRERSADGNSQPYNPRCELKTPLALAGGVQAVQRAAAGCPAQKLK